MKILYSVQATGNGHISRAMEILPTLERYGKVDIFLSGANSSLQLDAPVKYRSRGLCIFYNNNGALDYWKMAREFAPFRVLREVRDLPVEKYDLILNDFESITAMACAYKKVPSVNFGHQASFKSSKTPRPIKKDLIGEWILQNYARATQYVGLHFESYDDFILPPVIRRDILLAEPLIKNHITVYLPSFSATELTKWLQPLTEFQFQVFSKEIKEPYRKVNIQFMPVNKNLFTRSMINCQGIITGAGFEAPAEALYLGKKLMVIPIGGQYEQSCNAVALENMGVLKIEGFNSQFSSIFCSWINDQKETLFRPDHSTEAIISYLMHHCQGKKYELDSCYPELVF